MVPLLGHQYAGQRMGANLVIRHTRPDGWYLLGPRADLVGGVVAEFDWGRESDQATMTAATMLYDAFGIIELARAAARPFAAQVLAKLPKDEWTLTLAQMIAWMCQYLARLTETGIDDRGWPACVANGKPPTR